MGRVDIITGTLGKALGGASGGYTSGPRRDRRAAAPALAAVPVLELARAADRRAPRCRRSSCSRGSTELRDRLEANTRLLPRRDDRAGFNILPGEHPIVPIMIGDAALAGRMADGLLGRGVYVIGFSYPVVPQGKARIRMQISAAHTAADLDFAIEQFVAAREELAAG